MLRVRACLHVCLNASVCVACANRRRNAIKWKLLKKAKMRNENTRHTLHCSPATHHTHSFAFPLTPSLDNVTRQRVHCCRFCTNYAENMFGHVALLSPCFSFDFSQIFSAFPPHFVFLLQFESDPWSWGSVAAVYEATPLLLYRLNSNPKHVPTQPTGQSNCTRRGGFSVLTIIISLIFG